MERRQRTSGVERKRPRFSTLVVAGLLLCGLVLANVVGRFQVRAELTQAGSDDSDDSIGLSAVRTTDAGWPWTYAVIGNHRSLPLLHLDGGLIQRSVLAVLADAAVMLAIVVGGSWLFSQWWSRRRRLLQFGLMDVALLTTATALVLGLILVPRWQHTSDAAVIGALDVEPLSSRFNPPMRQVVWQPDRHEWLRWILGAKRLPPGSHVVGIDLDGTRAADAARLPRLQVIKLRGTVAAKDLHGLGSLPELVCLDLSGVSLSRNGGDPDDSRLTVPQLRRLIAPVCNLEANDLAGCPRLEELDLSRARFDSTLAPAIGRLNSLRILNLRRVQLHDDDLQQLSGLSHLTVLDLSGTAITDAGLKHLSRMPALRTLWLTDTAITDGGLLTLQTCPRLTTVWVVRSQVTPRGVARLRAARKQRLAAASVK